MIDQDKKPLLSLLICAYNVEKFMRKGLDVVTSMTGDFEIVICDDGSTDSTGLIADEYAAKFENLQVIHQSNMGLGGARNTAMDAANGKYIGFYDVDDVIPSDYFHIIQSTLNQNDGVDIVVFGYNEINEFYKSNISFTFDYKLCKNNDEIKNAYVEHLSGIKFNNGFTWNKLYRRDFIVKNNIRFGNQRIQQDEVFNCEVYKLADTLLAVPDVLYNYYIYQTGNNRSKYIPNRLEIYRNVRDTLISLCKYWNLQDDRIDNYIQKRFFTSVIEYLNFNLHHPNAGLMKEDIHKEILRTMKMKDVVSCIDWLLIHKQLTGNERKYAFLIQNEDVSGYERLYNRVKLISNFKIFLHGMVNKLLK